MSGFRQGEINGVIVRRLVVREDHRGWLVELFRHDELDPPLWPVMAYISQTLPGVVRGPHEHKVQSDHFVFLGTTAFKLYLWDNRPDSASFGVAQTFLFPRGEFWSVVIPPGVVHAYRNVGQEPGLVFNCPNRLYAGWGRKELVDEVRHEDRPDSPFRLEDI
ncbi:MAG: dTDP-4-dehydrorhamnose 3,5-epimerase family protein [Thermoguttaceae bacterium]|nr:dTDP-4-dehydrorhamnose 3,5-epimerase family protein [Thermoguttaceae bacterium]MDW8078669.1 dTDP-4-dehydrorhamnose 3,5-epimerase family protein [Thermoguttaceae bacterium]